MIVDQHELRVYSGSTELEPLETAGTLTADRGWSPFIQGTITVRAPASDAVTEPGSTITLELTQRFGDFGLTRDLTDLHAGDTTASLTSAYAGGTTADLTALLTAASWNTPARAATGRTFTLVVTARTRTRDEHRLTVESLEATVQNWVSFSLTDVVFEAETLRDALNGVIGLHRAQTTATLPTIHSFATPTRIGNLTHTIACGQPTIGYLDTLNTISRARIYSPGDSSLALIDIDTAGPGSLEVATGENLIDWEVSDARQGLLMMKFTGTADDPTTPLIKSEVLLSNLQLPHERYIDFAGIYTPRFERLDNQLAVYVDRLAADESPVRLTTINDYSVLPGSAITYTLPDESPVNDSIDAITWQLGGRWEMSISV